MGTGVPAPSYEMASVLFMDVVSYSLRSIEDQSEVLTILQSVVRESAEYQQASTKEEVLSLPTGDGMALVFLRDPVSPAKCALEVAASLQVYPEIKLRMGLHTGPVRRHADIKEEANVVGGGINTAQRVMDCGDAGHILMSKNVAEVLEQLRGWNDSLQDLGVHEVKHGIKVHLYNLCKDGLGNPELPGKVTSAQTLAAILEPQPDPPRKQVLASLETAPKRLPMRWIAACLAVIALAAAVYWFAGRAKPIDSLAVMPFVNVGADPNTEYLSDGITENLINNLSQLPKLRVLPRSRVFRYKGRETDTEKIGRELNVRAVLTGRVVQRGDSLNVQAELVDVAADSQLWGRQYNRKFSEIIPVQEEIAKEVAEKLRLRPTGEEQKRLTKRYTENPEAHQLFLRGRYYWNRRTAETLKRAAEYFQQAVGKDPGYALAWAGLADSYALYSTYDVLPPSEVVPKAKEAASKALALDDTLAEPHAALGFAKATYDWDWAGAEREFKRAIELNPNYATAHFWYSICLAWTGRLDEAAVEAKLAREADTLSPIIGSTVGQGLYYARRYDQAIEQLGKSLEMDPNFYFSRSFLGMAYEQVARHEEAIAEFQKALSLSGGKSGALGALGHAYAVSGKRAEAQKTLAELKDLSKRDYVAPYDIALIYVGLGDKAQALAWLANDAYKDHSVRLVWIKIDPRLDSLRGEARFQDLLRRMGLGS